MTKETLINFVQEIVAKAVSLKDKHTDMVKIPVNYACIFCQSAKQYKELNQLALELGTMIEDTSSGPLMQLTPAIHTIAGQLQLLKIRNPDETRPELGDADFTVPDYQLFKKEYVQKPGFQLIDHGDFEMIELMDFDFDVRVYFSDPPLDKQLGLV